MTSVNTDTMVIVEEAMKAFIEYWNNNAKETDVYETIKDGAPQIRNAQTAMEMLFNYIEDRKNFLKNIELIEIEQPFAVPLDPSDQGLIYIGRWDKVIREKGQIKGIEHKTTTSYKKNGPFQNAFMDGFSPNSQIDGYLFALSIRYGKAVSGILVDAALVHKDVHDGIRFIQVQRQFAQIETWLWETRYWINQIEANWEVYEKNDFSQAEYLGAFPKNTISCTQYGGCPYLDLCKAWSNPERYGNPPGFIEEKWEPFDELKILPGSPVVVGQDDVDGQNIRERQRVYDNTRVSEFRTCPRKYYYRHVRHWKPTEDRLPLIFGGAWHAAMDVVWDKLCK